MQALTELAVLIMCNLTSIFICCNELNIERNKRVIGTSTCESVIGAYPCASQLLPSSRKLNAALGKLIEALPTALSERRPLVSKTTNRGKGFHRFTRI